jgi:hypothetical protein
MRALRDWNPGNNVFENAHHQQAVLALRELAGERAYEGTPREWVPGEEWPGKIVSAGPSGEADFTNSLYWVKKCYMEGAAYNAQANFNTGSDYDAGPVTIIVPAMNLAERAAAGHGLDTGGDTIVWVRAWFDRGNPQIKHYLFDRATGGSPVKFGKVKTVWSPGTNAVVLTPVVSSTSTTATGTADVTCYIMSPFNRAAVWGPTTLNDIYPYLALSDGTYMLAGSVFPATMTAARQGWYNNGSGGSPNVLAGFLEGR